MARTEIPVDVANDAGFVFAIDTTIDATNGMSFTGNSGRHVLFVENTGGSDMTVTVKFAPDEFGRTGQKDIVVAAGATKVIGPFNTDLYNQDSASTVYVDFSAGAAGNVCVLKVSL